MKRIFITILFFALAYPSIAFSERKTINEIPILEGNYYLEASFNFEKYTEKITQIDLVNLTYVNNEIIMTNEEKKDYPIIGTIKNDIFTATLKDAKGSVKFKGAVKDATRIEGEMSGIDNKGENQLTGNFLLYPAN